MQIYRRDSNGSARDDINSINTSPFCDVRYRVRTSENYTGNSVTPNINAVEQRCQNGLDVLLIRDISDA